MSDTNEEETGEHIGGEHRMKKVRIKKGLHVQREGVAGMNKLDANCNQRMADQDFTQGYSECDQKKNKLQQ